MLATVRKGKSWRVQITAPNGSVRLFGRFYSEKECARMDSVVTQHTKMAVQSNSRNWITAPLPAGVSYPFSSGTAKRASNCCSRSCRICQIRPSKKPVAIHHQQCQCHRRVPFRPMPLGCPSKVTGSFLHDDFGKGAGERRGRLTAAFASDAVRCVA